MKQKVKASILLGIIYATLNTAVAAPRAEQRFGAPDAAVSALGAAVATRSVDDLRKIFGAGSHQILSSGDPVADRAGLQRFDELFRADHSLESRQDGSLTLLVGTDKWPFPVPLVKGTSGWYFDTQQGKDEILNRRIGQSELSAIVAMQTYTEAQREYAAVDRDGDGFAEYAQLFISSPGRKNGLFWPRKPGELPSPLGPIVAKAAADGYTIKQNKQVPFHGYFFRILKAQGAHAAGGKMDYITEGGRMTKGFALIAYPAEWGASGIMSFIVNREGVVFQKNLGAATSQVAPKIKEFNPDNSWQKLG